MPLTRAAVAVGIVATMSIGTSLANPRSAAGTAKPCVRLSRNVAHYCGPATARLSVFPLAFFRHGLCTRKRVGAVRLFQVRVGARSLDGSRANDGLPYFSLGSAGSRSQRASGNVIAFFRSKRWIGRVLSLNSNRGGGTFVAEGFGGNRGRARGQFRC
jgi:hypothetical protein